MSKCHFVGNHMSWLNFVVMLTGSILRLDDEFNEYLQYNVFVQQSPEITAYLDPYIPWVNAY